ncbi:MAG TPA: efflux RND transporter permease subunit [Victivallales bacterium]|nr:efflux RND transporter permease subunit [Victivallales bacterium]
MNFKNQMENRETPISWMVKNPVAANLLMLFFIIGGLFSLLRIKQEVFPDLTLDTVTVSVAYPGASPEEVEKGIILVTEEAIRGIEGVKEVRSTAAEGYGTVVAELFENTDYSKTYQDIKNEIDRITTFPEEAEKPIVTLDARKREVLSVVVYGESSEKSLREIAERVRDYLLEDENITQIELSGIKKLEIKIEVPLDNLRKHSLTLSDIKNAVQNSSLELPGGSIKPRLVKFL